MPETLAVLTKPLEKKHLWIEKNFLRLRQAGPAAQVITIVNQKGKFFARGTLNPASSIAAARIFTYRDEPLDVEFFCRRISAAYKRRQPLLFITNAYRLIFSEADFLPGFICDIYADTAVFGIFTAGATFLVETFVQALRVTLNIKFIYQRAQKYFQELEDFQALDCWHGLYGNNIIRINEAGAFFDIDIVNGHKTGFYLDQRKNRLAIKDLVKNKRVLDLFSFCGGFSIQAALGGAKYVLAVDIKNDWLKMLKANAIINHVQEKISTLQADVFDFLKTIQPGDWDVIILDPPSFLKTKAALAQAIKGYRELNMLCAQALEQGAILATFSCSHNMSGELFSRMLKDSFADANKDFEIIKRCHQDIDHPINEFMPHTNYLRGYLVKVK